MQPLGAAAQMALPGSFAVSEGGAATYDIPIDVPPGTAGMEPKLSLTYSSGGGNGLLGVGWALSGLSQISRCAQTVATDGQHGGVNYDADDRFCLNGDLLVAIAGTYGADGTEYRTQSEGFSRIVSHGTAGYGPASFTVWTKAGLKMEFGHTTDSRIEAQGKSTVRLWALNRVTDTTGNYMTVTYAEDPIAHGNGNYRPDRIDYTGNGAQAVAPFASVRFVYEQRPDIFPTMRAGSRMQQTKRLTHVETYDQASLVSSYRIHYAPLAQGWMSQIASIEKCDSANTCLPATTFTPSSGPSNFGSYINSFYWSTSPGDADAIGFADPNGDGAADFWAWAGSGHIYMKLSDGDGTFTDVPTLFWSTDKVNDGPVGFADINGNGRSDFWGWNHQGYIFVSFANEDGSFGPLTQSFFWSTSKSGASPIGFADANGDGAADFWGWSDSGHVYMKLSNRDGTFTDVPALFWSTDKVNDGPVGFADINGNGRSDFWGWSNQGYVFVSFANEDGSFGPLIQSFFWSTSKSGASPVGFADFNGDGAADFWGWSDSGHVYFAISRGDGAFSFGPTLYWSTMKSHDSPIDVANLDGDAGADLWAWAGSGHIYAWRSKRSTTFEAMPALFWTTTKTANRTVGFADIDGDGISDFWGLSPNGSVYVNLRSGQPQRLVASISNGLGSTSHIAYASLSEAGAPYTKDSGANAASYPEMDIHAPAYVVSELRADDGIGGVTTTRYRYGGLKYDHERRQALGFRWREVEQVEAQVVKRTEYRQDFPFVGMTELSQTRVLALDAANNPQGQTGTNLVRESSSTYGCKDFINPGPCVPAPNRRYYVYQASSTERGWDLDGSELPETETASTYDDYGNALTVNVTVTDKPSSPTEVFTKNTTNTYAPPNLTDWILGRLTRAEVTSTAP